VSSLPPKKGGINTPPLLETLLEYSALKGVKDSVVKRLEIPPKEFYRLKTSRELFLKEGPGE